MFSTTRFNYDVDSARFADRQPDWIDMLMQSKRIRMTILHVQVALIFDVSDAVIIGRKTPESEVHIDLEPYQARDLGVSRQHLILKWEDGRLVAIDNRSANHSWLNGEVMLPDYHYPIHHNDRIKLGAIQLQIEFLNSRE